MDARCCCPVRLAPSARHWLHHSPIFSLYNRKKKLKHEGNDYQQTTYHKWTKFNELQQSLSKTKNKPKVHQVFQVLCIMWLAWKTQQIRAIQLFHKYWQKMILFCWSQARSRLGFGRKIIYKVTKFCFSLYVWNKFFCAQQNLEGHKKFEGVLPRIPPEATGLTEPNLTSYGIYVATCVMCHQHYIDQTVNRFSTRYSMYPGTFGTHQIKMMTATKWPYRGNVHCSMPWHYQYTTHQNSWHCYFCRTTTFNSLDTCEDKRLNSLTQWFSKFFSHSSLASPITLNSSPTKVRSQMIIAKISHYLLWRNKRRLWTKQTLKH